MRWNMLMIWKYVKEYGIASTVQIYKIIFWTYFCTVRRMGYKLIFKSALLSRILLSIELQCINNGVNNTHCICRAYPFYKQIDIWEFGIPDWKFLIGNSNSSSITSLGYFFSEEGWRRRVNFFSEGDEEVLFCEKTALDGQWQIYHWT